MSKVDIAIDDHLDIEVGDSVIVIKADGSLGGHSFHGVDFDGRQKEWDKTQGRFPANFIHDGSDEVVGLFPYQRNGGYL